MSDDEVGRCWDENAEVWARHVRAGYDHYRDLYNNPAFFEFVGDLAGRMVLDAGCGEGYNTRLLARQGATMTGADISTKMIELARAEEQREPLGIRYEAASISDLSLFADATFDAVVSTMALMDCADYEGTIREFQRVLRPGGLLAFNVCHPCFTYAIRDWDYDEKGDVVGIRLGAYFQRGSHVERWRFGAAPDSEDADPFTVIYFHRTLAEFFNPFCAAGFSIEAVAEPQPTEEACQADPRLRKHRLVPQTLCVKARKAER
ncbi:MAG: class I SAM-dependent methyltransferase [Armatimonadota bacterium]|nr:MAG: class I SAM-dependent methyltransferase [Armatimonadota bacterium]